MEIEIKFKKPVDGYWDNGTRNGGVFYVDKYNTFSKKHTCFGAYDLNFFFNVKTGRSDKETISRAKRYIKKHYRHPFTFVD